MGQVPDLNQRGEYIWGRPFSDHLIMHVKVTIARALLIEFNVQYLYNIPVNSDCAVKSLLPHPPLLLSVYTQSSRPPGCLLETGPVEEMRRRRNIG